MCRNCKKTFIDLNNAFLFSLAMSLYIFINHHEILTPNKIPQNLIKILIMNFSQTNIPNTSFVINFLTQIHFANYTHMPQICVALQTMTEKLHKLSVVFISMNNKIFLFKDTEVRSSNHN